MKKNNTSFFKQTAVLTSRYLKIFFNDKQNLILSIAIPLLTILIVSFVACGDMYSSKVKVDHSVNDGYPILSWELVDQENEGEFTLEDSGIGIINDSQYPNAYVIFSQKNDYQKFEKPVFSVKSETGEDIFVSDESDVEFVKGEDCTYSAYVPIDEDLEIGKKYTVTFKSKSYNTDNDCYGELENSYDFVIPDAFDDVNSLVKTNGNAYNISEALADGFNLDDYVYNNQEKIASLSKATMSMNGKDYVIISDAPSLAFIFSDKSKYGYDNYEWLNYNYYLNCDIDVNNYYLTPLGYPNAPFTGEFDGNGHRIVNMNIYCEADYIGLFGVLDGTVKNLGIENANVSTNLSCAGAFAGILIGDGKVYNSYVKNSTITASGNYVGGIVGCVDSNGKNTEIHTCYSKDVKLVSDSSHIGGLVGDLKNGVLKACYTINEIETDSEDDNIGIITGSYDSKAVINNCYYLSTDSEYEALGSETSASYCKENNIISVEKESFKEYAEKIIYNSVNEDDDPSYGFKKDGQLDLWGGTQTGLFMLVCVAIFVGICNSIQEICKERNILKREYMTNLKLTSYVSSKLIIQAFVCAAQMILVLVVFAIFARNKEMPSSGVIFNSVWTEYFITMFLLTFASDTMALVISSIVKNSSTANTFIPIILIVQIVFSGVLFDLGDAMDKFASLMVSKWGIAGLAISSRLNNARTKFLLDSPNYELQLGESMSVVKNLYVSSSGNLLMVWGILIAFIIVCSALSTLLLTTVKKDKR